MNQFAPFRQRQLPELLQNFNSSRAHARRIGVVRWSFDLEAHIVECVPRRVTSVARTIADCFKYRNKVGLDVALEALRDGWRKKRFSMAELSRCAEVCRVSRVMKPYLEAIA